MLFVDTDIVIDILRQNHAAVRWLSFQDNQPVILAGFVAMEIIQGCRDRFEQRRTENFLRSFPMTWPEKSTCARALQLYSRYHPRLGIGIIDALLAQMAIDRHLPLYSLNRRHYSGIQELTVIHPYRK